MINNQLRRLLRLNYGNLLLLQVSIFTLPSNNYLRFREREKVREISRERERDREIDR